MHKILEMFGMRRMRDYNIYIESDVLLQTDVVENLRDVYMLNYSLDHCTCHC